MALDSFPKFAQERAQERAMAADQATAPKSPFECAAQTWSAAKELLVDAENSREKAEQRHIEARQMEAAAWQELQVAAGRAEPSGLIAGGGPAYPGLRR